MNLTPPHIIILNTIGPRNVWFKLQINIFTHIDDSGYSHAERRTLLGCLVLKLLFVNQSFGQKNRLLTYPRRYNVWQMKFKCCWKEKILCLVCNYPRTKVITSNDKTTESSCKLAKVWTSVSSSKILGFPLLLVNIINVSLWQSCELVPLSRLLKKGKQGAISYCSNESPSYFISVLWNIYFLSKLNFCLWVIAEKFSTKITY